MVASHVPPTGDLACNPGMCPDWESNQRPFGLQTHAQSTKLHQPGLKLFIFFTCLKVLETWATLSLHSYMSVAAEAEQPVVPLLGRACALCLSTVATNPGSHIGCTALTYITYQAHAGI